MSTEPDELTFADEDDSPAKRSNKGSPAWNVLIVDDEESVHEVTHLALDKFEFEGHPLAFISAYSGAEAKAILATQTDIALILLDVVMESDDAGLEVARHVRQQLHNKQVRIVLRTGQPGQAPEEQVVRDYDINDYREKTELTRRKFFTTVYAALRAYRDIITIERHRRGLEKVISSSSSIFKMRSLDQFIGGLMSQVLSVLKLDDSALEHGASAFMVAQDENAPDHPTILTGSGVYRELQMVALSELDDTVARQRVQEALRTQTSHYFDDACVFMFKSQSGRQGLIYVHDACALDDAQKRLLDMFCSNICIAYSNVALNEDLEHTQHEAISMLGTVAEFRSSETANHVVRVAKYAALLARKAGLPDQEAERIELAAPLHDIGKIGIPDRILMKPGRLTEEEYTIMQRHADIGHQMLVDSKRPLLQAAAVIAHQHQEKWDGSGYPQQLAGEQIHLYGRIVALCDVFDALLSRRCYKAPWDMDSVIEFVRTQRGRHFDPTLADLLLDNIDDFRAIATSYRDDPQPAR